MKLASCAVITILAALALAACGNGKPEVVKQSESQPKERNKVLIAYFSHTGNTRAVATKIQELTGGDIFEIVPEKPYPKEYSQCVKVGRKEWEEKLRPALADTLASAAEYGTVFVGYPNWFGTMPMAVFTWLESVDLAGKAVVPFCTHGGSRLGNSVDDIKETVPEAKVLQGLAIRGTEANSSQPEIEAWLDKLGIRK